MGKTLTNGERAARAGERLSEARGQLAAVQARMAAGQAALDALGKLEQTAAASVAVAEKTLDQHAQLVVDAHATALIVVGTDEAASAQEAHGAAVDARTEARQALDAARAALDQTRQKVESDGASIREQIAADAEVARDLQRQITSLQRAQTAAHKEAELETSRQALHEIGESFIAYLNTLEKWARHPAVVQVWHEGQYLPTVLSDARLNAHTIHGLLLDAGPKHAAVVASLRVEVQGLIDKADRNAAFEASRKPQASTIAE